MEFIDVLFPINLGPLTYKCPDNLIDKALPGMLVSAPLKNQTAKGIILSKSSHAARSAPNALRYISDIHGGSPILEPPLLKLLDWMSDYYIANKGVVLKNMLPKEAFRKVKARETQAREQRAEGREQRPLNEIEENIISAINGSVVNK